MLRQVYAIGVSCALHVAAGAIVQAVGPPSVSRTAAPLVADLVPAEPEPPAPRAEPRRRLTRPEPVKVESPRAKVEPAKAKVDSPPPAPSLVADAPPDRPPILAEAPPAPVMTPPPAAPEVSLPRAEPPPAGNAAVPTGISITTSTPIKEATGQSGPTSASLFPNGAPGSSASLRDVLGSGRLGVTDRAVPRYPESARRAGAQGITVLRVHVLDTGRVGEIHVEESAGHPALDQAARDAVRRWRFEAGKVNGAPVSLWVLIPFEFRLR